MTGPIVVTLVGSSKRELFNHCRRLLAEGHDPETPIIAKYSGDESGAEIRATLRAGAELSPLGKVA